MSHFPFVPGGYIFAPRDVYRNDCKMTFAEPDYSAIEMTLWALMEPGLRDFKPGHYTCQIGDATMRPNQANQISSSIFKFVDQSRPMMRELQIGDYFRLQNGENVYLVTEAVQPGNNVMVCVQLANGRVWSTLEGGWTPDKRVVRLIPTSMTFEERS